MRMKKAEVEFVAFEAQDVIVTSGTLRLSGYFDGTKNDLSVKFRGQWYTDFDSLRTAFDQSGKAYASAFDYRTATGLTDGADVFKNAFDDDKSDSDPASKYKAGNGSYTYDFSVFKWIHDYNQ